MKKLIIIVTSLVVLAPTAVNAEIAQSADELDAPEDGAASTDNTTETPPEVVPEEDICRTQVEMFQMDDHCDVSIFPLNAVMGYGMTFDAEEGVGSFTIGVDIVTVAWEALFVTVTEMRISFYTITVPVTDSYEESGIVADFFIAPRVGYALYPGRTRIHQIVFGVGAGWGAIATAWGGRAGGGDGGFAVSLSIRYAVMGFMGLEVQAILPVTGEIGEHYPASIYFNLTGLPLLLIAAVAH